MPITGHIISHTHWDREWFLTSKYTAEWLRPFFDSLFNMLEKYPDYCFVLDGQTIMIEDYLALLSPSEKFVAEKKLKKYISQSRLLAGPYYLQPDWRLVSGESLVRNMMLGHQMADDFGGVMKVGWLLDNFGQISQVPQIHKGFGINGVYLWRGIEVDTENIYSEYLWESPDETQVLSIYLLNSYRNAMRLAEYADIAQDRLVNETQKLISFATTDNVLLMNGYDQEMVPDDVLPLIEQQNAKSNGIRLVQTTPDKYLQTIQKEIPVLQVLKGAQNSGRYISIFPGTLSARMYLKQMNSACENLLTKWAEPVSAWLWLLGGEYPQESINFAWKELLQNHPHDNICGVSIDDVHSDMEVRFARSKEISEKIIERALTTISANINTENERNLVVFNPLPHKRDAIIKIVLKVDNDFSIYDADTGRPVPHQVGAKNNDLKDVYFSADLIPGLGYKTFYIGPKKTEQPLADVVTASAKERRMENKYLLVQIESNGSVTVTDKISGRIFKSIAYFEDGADCGDTYNYSYPEQDTLINSLNSKAQITLIDQGPLLAQFKIELSMPLPASLSGNRKKRSKKTSRFPIVTYVKIESNSARLDFHTRLKNVVKDHRLRVMFPTNIETCRSFSDKPFDVDESPVSFSDYPQELPDNIKQIMIGARESVPGSSLPLQSFCYLKDEKGGAAIITRGLTEYEITEKHKIALTLFRSVGWLARGDLLTRVGDAGPMIFTPEAQCLRQFDFNYSFLPFRDKTAGFLFRPAEQFNTDLKAVFTAKHKGSLDYKRGLLCLDTDKDQLHITAVKKAERGNELIVRLFNPAPRDVNGVLTFTSAIERAAILNLNEEFQSELKFKKNTLDLTVPFKKIITIGLQFKQSASLQNISFPETRILSAPGTENEDFLSVIIPAVVTKGEINREKQRAGRLEKELQFYREKLIKIDTKIAANKNGNNLADLKKQRMNIWGKVTSLIRAELEARLSWTLNQKKYESIYKSGGGGSHDQQMEYDSILKDIGYGLNTARVEKRAAEYIIDLYKS